MAKVIRDYGCVDIFVNNAKPIFKGISACSGISLCAEGRCCHTFYAGKAFPALFWQKRFDRQHQPESESCTAAKGGIAALTHSLAVSLSGKVRVNSVSPGWIDTDFIKYEGPDASQHPAGRVGDPMDIANAVLFLASEKAGFITGENICVDGGMTKLVIYHNDHGWKLEE